MFNGDFDDFVEEFRGHLVAEGILIVCGTIFIILINRFNQQALATQGYGEDWFTFAFKTFFSDRMGTVLLYLLFGAILLGGLFLVALTFGREYRDEYLGIWIGVCLFNFIFGILDLSQYLGHILV